MNVHLEDFQGWRSQNYRPGFCMDIGAPSSVIGIRELRRIYSAAGLRYKELRKSTKRFRFGDSIFQSLGQTSLPLTTPSGIPDKHVRLDVVSADVPALVGLDFLDYHSLMVDTVTNRLTKRTVVTDDDGSQYVLDEWHMPLTRKHHHVYAQMSKLAPQVLYTRQELHKVHRQFCHPSAESLMKLLKTADKDKLTPETYQNLQEISRRCDPCQRIANAPLRFRVSLGTEKLRFNETVFIDVMYIDNRPVLHVVDSATHFSAARFLPDMSVKTAWSTIIECWSSIYTGLPNRIRVDAGSNFGESFISLAKASNIDVDPSGIEAHSSLGIGERYHQPLRTTFRKLKLQYDKVHDSTLLAMSVKAMNDTLGPEGCVPSTLVFGEYPAPILSGVERARKGTLEDRSKIAETARREMEKHMASLKLKRALRHKVPPAANVPFDVGDKVLVWREKIVNNRIGEWVGPFIVESFDLRRKVVHVRDVKVGPAKPFGFAQVKRYMTIDDTSRSFFTELHDILSSFRSYYNEQDIHLTEILQSDDPRANCDEMSEAKRREIKGLLDRGTFKVILREEIPPDGNVLPGRFVLAIKSTEDGKVKFKARYVIGGHRDRLKHYMVHTSQNLHPSSVRLLLALAEIHGFDTWTSDVTQAYLQSAVPLMRDVFIKDPVPEFELDPTQCLQLLRPLYGLCESGDLWYKTLADHHEQDLCMKPLRSDPAFHVSMNDNRLTGMSGTYVDDILRAGNQAFREHAKKTATKFEMAEDNDIPCRFVGFKLQNGTDGTLELNQDEYVRKLKPMPTDGSYSEFASLRMKLAWLAHTRPDCMYEVSQMTQVTKERFAEDRQNLVKRINRTVQYVQKNPASIRFPKLKRQGLHVIGISDASFASNRDSTSHLGFLCLLADSEGRTVPIQFKSYKARRVTRSVMAAELMAFSDLFDSAYTLASELRQLLPDQSIPVKLFTDNKSLFDVISKGTRTSEKRLMIDIAAAREGFAKHDINDIGFVRSEHNVSDGLTKPMKQTALHSLLVTGKLDLHVTQWIIRAANDGSAAPHRQTKTPPSE